MRQGEGLTGQTRIGIKLEVGLGWLRLWEDYLRDNCENGLGCWGACTGESKNRTGRPVKGLQKRGEALSHRESKWRPESRV